MLVILTGLRNVLYKTVTKSMPAVNKVQSRRMKSLDIFFLMMTHLAGVGVYITFVPTAWWIHPSPDAHHNSNELLKLIAVSTYIGNFIKNLFACPRPAGVWQPKKEIDFGMPSNHTMNAVANALFLIDVLNPNWVGVIFLLCYALVVAVSRVYTGVHTPADVVVGAMLGIFSFGFYKLFPDLPRTFTFVVILFVVHYVLLTLHPLCFSRYTPCYWRSTVGLGYCLLCFILDVADYHTDVEDTPPYSCSIKHPFELCKAFATGGLVTSVCGIVFLLLRWFLSKQTTFLDKYGKFSNKFRAYCHLDPLEFDDNMNMTSRIYTVQFFTYYISGMLIAFFATVISPIVVQKYIPNLFTKDLCSTLASSK
ncbi:sphingosine-1-phosphate phosphohydrolase, putative [Entamoeba invadens IP1]|uniref:sphingosine-1-phosphate phosphohydrolase, putative n=1 Tax=Entamoeba invadens IP1 TaxID=370355 RepID=UPI0002C3EC76|nr:sphingosine-1-phosphate phosphohydrolase, putative [Entamoeba invadens IP1]ELP93380.1 sphingosine-1-phosphate phosphohydrolase, putative [Entamoeba invadens IP1]|eukprot:XP_004260151.1 sphingosine-1-phosphate phosphohydrolase, putative [Entamoeba invadens IP1]